MRAIINTLAGATISLGVASTAMAVIDQGYLLAAFAFSTFLLAFITLSIWAIDRRVRTNLLMLTESVMFCAFQEDKPLIYNEADTLLVELKEGRSLAQSAHMLGRLAEQLDMANEFTDSGV